MPPPWGPQAMTAVIRDVFARHVEGESPENVEMMFRRVYSSGFTQRPDPTVIGAFSGIEIACWDILGKDRDRPVWALMGGRMNDRVRAYTYLYPMDKHPLPAFWGDADMAAEAALDLVGKGWTALKFDPAGPYTIRGGHQPSLFDIETSAAFCATLRKAVGPRTDLLFGTHGQFTASGAIRLARAIVATDPLWFEEPVPPDDWEGLRKVARATSIPVATGERLDQRPSSPRPCAPARRSCNPRSAARAVCGRARRSPPLPKRPGRRSRRTSTRGPSNGRRTSTSP